MEALKLVQPEIIAPVVPERLPYNKPDWWDSVESRESVRRHTKIKLVSAYRQIVKDYLLGQLKGRVKVESNNGKHVFFEKDGALWLFKNNESIKVNICIAKKLNGVFVGNSSSLARLRTPKGKIVSSGTGGRFKIQEVLESCMMMLPFEMFKEIRLDINSIEVIDRGPSENLKIIPRWSDSVERPTHFMGALCFKIKAHPRSADLHYQGQDQYFLFDIDRNDLALKNLNFFISRLSRPVTSIADAYESLKPEEVRNAERFMGPVQRQGEWFFIPVQGEYKERREHRTGQRGIGEPVNALLQSKGNRAHYVKYLSEEGFVKGQVWHGGREHKPIELTTWCKPVPNTANESYKISGAID